MSQTYCVRADIESILGVAGVLACIDDDGDGTESAAETLHITNAIERAAVEMNSNLGKQYHPLTALADNDWCKWCNAYLAAEKLTARRSNPPPPSVIEAAQQYRADLLDARWGRFQVPDQAPSFDHTCTVSNFQPELGKTIAPIRVDRDESTGAEPDADSGRKRYPAGMPGNL